MLLFLALLVRADASFENCSCLEEAFKTPRMVCQHSSLGRMFRPDGAEEAHTILKSSTFIEQVY